MELCKYFHKISYDSSSRNNWRRIHPDIKYPDTADKQLKFGDLEIYANPTFHIEGDSTAKNSTTPDWHTGDEHNGTLELHHNNRLTLWLEPKESKN